ncbi:MAG: hypothetical protein EVA62_03415 [Halieaceae bacterium]|jgi:hypothetical protein|nr:MAG: hypothetical protein EVA62_03415 [Halieaceae bacterium]
MAEAKTKAAPKAAAKKAAVKKAPAKAKKAPAKKKPAAKTKAKAKASTKAKTRARPKAIDTGRNALLAGLGVYGKAYDQVLEQFASLQEQVDEAQTRLTERRKQAEDLYKSLVKRGTAVEKEALKALADLELDSLADRSKLEAQMKKAKSRFDDLKTKFGKAA